MGLGDDTRKGIWMISGYLFGGFRNLHLILGILGFALLLHLSNAWYVSCISEKGEAPWACCWEAAYHNASVPGAGYILTSYISVASDSGYKLNSINSISMLDTFELGYIVAIFLYFISMLPHLTYLTRPE